MVRAGTYTTLISIAISIAITLWTLANLPETGTFPIHWNIAGEANGFATREEFGMILWILVATTAGVGLLFSILPNIAPLRDNLMKSSKAYMTGWFGVLIINVCVVALIAYLTVRGAKPGGESLNVSTAVKPLFFITGIFLAILGNYLPKTRPNWFVGVRTPWTLSSAQSWEKTHRLAGALFVLSGLATIISAIALPVTWMVSIFICALTFSAAISIIASYYYWKAADDKN